MIATLLARLGLWIATFVGVVVLFASVAAGVLSLGAALPGFGAAAAALLALTVWQVRHDATERPGLTRAPTLAHARPSAPRSVPPTALEAVGRPVEETPDARPLPRTERAIVFSGVTFSTDDCGRLLEDVSLLVLPGSRVGVSGLSAAQKRAVVALLLRQVDPDAGRILLGGVDVRKIRLTDLRRQFAVALPDAVAEWDTISDAIGSARPGSSLDEIVAAADAVGAHRFVSELSDGYETSLEVAAAQLVPGERYLLALARACLQDAPIVVVEQPPRLIDSEGEIREAISRVSDGRTCLVLADRPTDLAGVHGVFHLVEGRVREPLEEETLFAGDDFEATRERMLAHIERRKHAVAGEP
jgi:ATP-binding cassette subfamily B protein